MSVDHEMMTPGREMDAAVAEARGWREVRIGAAQVFTVWPATGETRAVPPYSTDEVAAWRLVLALQAEGHYVAVKADGRGGETDVQVYLDNGPRRVGETMPEAVCRAVLAAGDGGMGC